MLSRICTRCKERKPLAEFYRDRTCRYGRKPHCKACYRAGRNKESDRRYNTSEKGRARGRAYADRDRARGAASERYERYKAEGRVREWWDKENERRRADRADTAIEKMMDPHRETGPESEAEARMIIAEIERRKREIRDGK